MLCRQLSFCADSNLRSVVGKEALYQTHLGNFSKVTPPLETDSVGVGSAWACLC